MIGIRQILQLAAAGAALLLGACAAVPEFPPADLEQVGWTVWSGQAVWQPADERAPRLAGDLLVAAHADGELLINFVKPPLPLFTAQRWHNYWRIRFVERDRVYAGRGRPPAKRFVWFALPALFRGEPPPGRWQVEDLGNGAWQLQQPRSGESIRIALDP